MSAPALTTKTRIKNRLSITATSFDDVIDRLILSVTARIETMCGRHFALATYTRELYDGSDIYGTPKSMLVLKNGPVASIASIEYKTGLNTNPTWVAFSANDYDVDLNTGILTFGRLPGGKQNIRVTYTAGYSASSIGIDDSWTFNYINDAWVVDGDNLTFVLPENASEVVVYADGLRILPANYTFTADTDTVVFNAGSQPFSSLSIDYLPSTIDSSSADLMPLDVVEVCEEVVVRLFKKRDSEGRSSETFQESSITWEKKVFTDENIAAVKNYRRIWL